MKAILFFGSFLLGTTLQHSDAPALTLKDAIEVMADYELFHPEVPPRVDWYGWTEPNAQKIFVIKNADLAIRRKTVIHELLHVSRHFHSDNISDQAAEEEAVQIQADYLYRELFGK